MTTPVDVAATSAETPRSRRTLLRLAGAAAAGGAATLLTAQEASAAPSFQLNDNTNSMFQSSAVAAVTAPGAGFAYGGIGVTDGGLATVPTQLQKAALFGHATGTNLDYGVVAYHEGGGIAVRASSPFGTAIRAEGGDAYSGVVAVGGYGVFASGSQGAGVTAVGKRGAVNIVGWTNDAPPTRSREHIASSLDSDGAAGLWWCTSGGTPGTWQKIAGPGTAGAFHAITPTRVYDSRQPAPTPGVLAADSTRTVSVKDGRNVSGGAVTVADLVPAGATAIACNLGITGTTGGGYLAVNPGGNTTVTASTINWSADGQTLANGIIATINPATREVTVICGPGGSTHFFLDVTGYWR